MYTEMQWFGQWLQLVLQNDDITVARSMAPVWDSQEL